MVHHEWLTTLRFWCTYCQQRDVIKRNKQTFQVMLKENKVCFSKLKDCLIHYIKVFLTYHTSRKQNLNIFLLIFSIVFLNV